MAPLRCSKTQPKRSFSPYRTVKRLCTVKCVLLLQKQQSYTAASRAPRSPDSTLSRYTPEPRAGRTRFGGHISMYTLAQLSSCTDSTAAAAAAATSVLTLGSLWII